MRHELGPLLGGLSIERFGWGSVFLVAVPVMLLPLLLRMAALLIAAAIAARLLRVAHEARGDATLDAELPAAARPADGPRRSSTHPASHDHTVANFPTTLPRRPTMTDLTLCLWYDGAAEEAARFYAKTFPDSRVGAVQRAPSDFPSGKAGDVLIVHFTLLGLPCIGLNGGPLFKPNEAFSFQVATNDQEETDRYWNAIVGNGGQESACGWCKDKWGVSWQITPRVLTDALAAGGDKAKRAFDAMMQMQKIDVAAIETAIRHG